MIRFRSWAVSHPGAVRDHNEDSFVDRPEVGLWAVADGAGGHNSGEVASAMIKQALERVPAGLSASEMIAEVRAAIADTHSALLAEAARRGPQIMIASTVAVLLAHAEHYACLWAGDSRVYLLREGELYQLTRDHSLVQEMVDAGVVRPENAESHPRANVITRAVGADGDALELEKIVDRILPGDRFLLCSDGLFKALPACDVANLLDPAETSPADALIEAALRARATDNVTAIAVEALAEIGDSTVGV
jgi:serine/threonine-protein phosphatase Stp1